MVTFPDPAHFVSKSVAPPHESLAPTDNSTGGWPVLAHPPQAGRPPAPGHAEPAIRAEAHCTMLFKLPLSCWEKHDLALTKEVEGQRPTVTFTLPEA